MHHRKALSLIENKLNMPIKILFIDSTHPLLVEKLSEAGFICEYLPDILPNKVSNIIANYEGLILRSKIKIDKDIIDKASKLIFIGRVGAGLENIDIEYAHSKGIKCFNSPEGNRDAVGEHALGMLLTLFNKINIANAEVKDGKWYREKNRGIEIKGKTIGIIGYGNTGSAFAKKLKGFGVKVLAYDKYKSNFSTESVTESNLEDIFNNSDILSLHVPMTFETKNIVNKEFINSFNKNIYLINTSRGNIVNTRDMIDGLKSGKIIGACLDVLEYEDSSFENLFNNQLPPEFDYLKNNDNVILTPHIAGWTFESKIKLAEVLADKIIEKFS